MKIVIPASIQDNQQLLSRLTQSLTGRYEISSSQTTTFLGLGAPRDCVVVKKSAWVGVCVAIDQKKGVIEIEGITPNETLNHILWRTFGLLGAVIKKLFLMKAMNQLEKEVALVLESV